MVSTPNSSVRLANWPLRIIFRSGDTLRRIRLLAIAVLLLLAIRGGQRAAAEETAAGVKDVFDLLKSGKIEVKTQGNGIQSVDLSVRKKAPGPLTVKVPVGTFFVSAKASSQNMVTTAESEVTLNDSDWHTVSADAACANRPRHIPGDKDRFSIQKSPNQKELAQLMPFLDKANVDYATRQAAVWIATDNADYEDMGILQSSQNGVQIGRVINEEEVAAAMKLGSLRL